MSRLSRSAMEGVGLTVLSLGVLWVSLSLGRYDLSFSEVIQLCGERLVGKQVSSNPVGMSILFDVRWPRILAAGLIGGALALSGAAYQGLFRNPMVSPDLLGASAGAGFGAALALLVGWSMVGVQFSAFVGGLLAVGIAFCISRAVGRHQSENIIMLVLTGILVSTIFSAGISITKLCADPDNTLPEITFWLMGGLGAVRRGQLGWLLIPLMLGALPLLFMRWKFNLLSFGEEEAQALGIDVGKLRLWVVVCATLLTSASVAMCGMIGFVGLVVPHMARLLFGADHVKVMPASLWLGAVFLILVDDVARCAFPVEIPLGILCALVGAPFFLALMVKGRQSWI